MYRHLDKILAHAERELVSAKSRRPTDVLPLYKKFLKIEEHRLRLRHRAGGGGRELSALRVELVDVLLRHAFSAAAAFAEKRDGIRPYRLALLALGGYGRGELNPSSDVDVMFLHEARATDRSSYVGQMVEQMLYLLWDIGFKVGHSTRSIDEALALANSDMLTRRPPCWNRVLAGDLDLAPRFRETFERMRPRTMNANMSSFGCRIRRLGTRSIRQRLRAGAPSEERLRWFARLSESSLDDVFQRRRADHGRISSGRDWFSEADRRGSKQPMIFSFGSERDLHYAPAARPIFAFQRSGAARGATRLSRKKRHSSQRSVDEGLLRAHAKYFSRDRANHRAIRQRRVFTQGPRPF